MKRLCAILQSVMLSMLIIALGGGVSLVNCSHKGTVEIASVLSGSQGLTACEQDMADCCKADCHSKAMKQNCMSVKTLKIANSTVAQSLSFHFQDIPNLIFYAVQRWKSELPTATFATDDKYIESVETSPPRDYLRILRVLRI